MASIGKWTNIGKKGAFDISWEVLCEYRKDDQIRLRRVAHSMSKEEADYICQILNDEMPHMNRNVLQFIVTDANLYKNTQVNEGFLNDIFGGDDYDKKNFTTEVLQKIWQWEEDRKSEYSEAMGLNRKD